VVIKCGYEYSFQDLLFQALERLGESKYIELCGDMNVGRIGCPCEYKCSVHVRNCCEFKLYSYVMLIQMLEFLIANIFVLFGGLVWWICFSTDSRNSYENHLCSFLLVHVLL
jgi:hypothetical protein